MPSQKILEQKQAQVAALTEALKNSVTGVIVNYEGINVEDDTKLRKSLREAGCKYQVVKNTLLSRALKEAGIYVRYFPGGRTGNYLRITVGTPEQTESLLSFLKKYLEEKA